MTYVNSDFLNVLQKHALKNNVWFCQNIASYKDEIFSHVSIFMAVAFPFMPWISYHVQIIDSEHLNYKIAVIRLIMTLLSFKTIFNDCRMKQKCHT